MINLFVTTQTYAIEEGEETITPNLIKHVYDDRFRPLHRIIEVLHNNDPEQLAQYDDLYFDGMKELKSDPVQSRIETVRSEFAKKQEELLNDLETSVDKKSRSATKPRRHNKAQLPLKSLHEEIRNSSQGSPLF